MRSLMEMLLPKNRKPLSDRPMMRLCIQEDGRKMGGRLVVKGVWWW